MKLGLTATEADGVEVVQKLRELSELLGVKVVGIEDRLSRRTSRKVGLARWQLDVRSSAGGTWRAPVLDSADFRRVQTLNQWVTQFGRDLDARRLDAEDGRRALRLMHDAVEIAEGRRQRTSLARIDNLAAVPELTAACAALALVVEDALAPALRGQRKAACEHVGVDVPQNRHHAPPVEVDRSAFLCPMHPDELFCDHEGCMAAHYAQHHADDELTALRCFVCEKPVQHELDGPIPIFAEVQLHRGVPVAFKDPRTGGFLTNIGMEYRGVLLTTAMAWLCAEHVEAIELPVRMSWPTIAPSSVPEKPPWSWAG